MRPRKPPKKTELPADARLRVFVKGWEDGEPLARYLEPGDRWTLHCADSVSLSLPPVLEPPLVLRQRPRDISGSRIGVGAVTWEGALVLVAYLASLPFGTLEGKRVVELGAGLGAPGLVAAYLGANVVLTDREPVLEALRENVKHTKLESRAQVAWLEWGSDEGDAAALKLSEPKPDFILAADCVYIDGDGPSPSSEAFCRVARTMCGPNTKVLVAIEPRAQAPLEAFKKSAEVIFKSVKRLDLPSTYTVEHVLLYELEP